LAFYKDEKIALFIDGPNLYTSARNLGQEIDFRKLLGEFKNKGRLVRANYYTTIHETDEHNPVRPLVDWLAYNGFNVIAKTAREYTDREGRRRVRGSIDIELATDMLELAPHLDHVILFSGNGDFQRLVKAIKSQGVRVTVISTVKSQPQMIGDELRREADVYIDLDELSDLIARPRHYKEDRTNFHADDYDD